MISATELKLLATHKAPVVPLEKICDQYLGMSYNRASRLAAINQLPIPVFRVGSSIKAPLMVGTKDLADHIDRVHGAAAESWLKSQL